MSDLDALHEATWPPASRRREGGWTLRDGAGGGKRASAATWDGTGAPGEPLPRLIRVTERQDALDAQLEKAGHEILDPILFRTAPVAKVAPKEPVGSVYSSWPPLAVQARLWQAGGIGAARLAVMERAAAPKTTLLGRLRDTPSATAFVALARDTAFLHALEVTPEARRHGLGRQIMQAAARWAAAQGARDLAVVVTVANDAANALYEALGLTVVLRQHYRQAPGA